jgi:hypothetical protein
MLAVQIRVKEVLAVRALSSVVLIVLQSLGLFADPNIVYYKVTYSYGTATIFMYNPSVPWSTGSEYWYKKDNQTDEVPTVDPILAELAQELRGYPVYYVGISGNKLEIGVKSYELFDRYPLFLTDDEQRWLNGYSEVLVLRALRVVEGHYKVTCRPQPGEVLHKEPAQALPPAPVLPPEISKVSGGLCILTLACSLLN